MFNGFLTVALSRNTVTNRINSISSDFFFQLAERAKKISRYNSKKNIICQQPIFKKQKTSQRNSTLAGYVVIYKITKNNEIFSKGEFNKEC
jgi:hypothetical protein